MWGEKKAPPSSPAAGEALQIDTPQVHFTDVTSEAGIDFVHENGARGHKLLPETMGGGCAFLDYDADGDQDLLMVNSQRWPGDPRDAADAPPPTMALYRNDGYGHFDNVTAGSGLDVTLYGMAAAVGDYDNDGRVDVFISAVGANRLFHNEGNGEFLDVTAGARVGGDAREWSSGCGWLDYDNDGDLDLFVCNYLKWSAERDAAQDFRLPDGNPAYGRPQSFAGTFPYLYRNDGNGKFTDVSSDAGMQVRDPLSGAATSKSLGVTFNDFDGDGWIDIVVANDTVPNQLFHNRRNGTFEEIGALVGVALDSNGSARGAMGIDSAHFRNDDSLGIAVGNFANEMSALYVSRTEDMQFFDVASSAGLGATTRLELTFGIFYFDYDLDGRLDLFAANGHLEPEIARVHSSQQYEQSPQLFWNSGSADTGELRLVPPENCGDDLVRPIVGRGTSFADIDGDGDLDVVITAPGRAPRLLRNDQSLNHHWLRLKLTGTSCNRDSIGAQVEVQLQGRTLRRQVMPTRSYLSQVELPVTFGLGAADRLQSVGIRWPDGSTQVIHDLQVDRTYEIKQHGRATATVSVHAADLAEPPSVAKAGVEGTGLHVLIGEGRATCGSYLHLSGHAGSAQHPISDWPAPCEGPMCSKAPFDYGGLPSAPGRPMKHDGSAWAGARTPTCSASCTALLPPDSERPPMPLGCRVYRPPRSC